jgi:predicted nucleotidyltransferase
MILFELWEKVISFIAASKASISTEGILICGSLAKNDFRNGSDVDILFLNSELEFKMESIKYDQIIFDRIIATSDILEQILYQKTSLSNIFSLSFGLETQVIEDSTKLRKLLKLSKTNITRRSLSYKRDETKTPHNINEIFNLTIVEDEYKLRRNGIIIT